MAPPVREFWRNRKKLPRKMDMHTVLARNRGPYIIIKF